MRVRPGANYVRISRDMWRFFVDAYGGGPEVYIIVFILNY